MKISLVIPTWNAGPLLEEVLEAIEQNPGAEELERVAVDSASADDTVERLRRHRFRVVSIPQREFNHGATRDLAIAETSGDVIALLTQDATPADSQWLPRLVESFADPSVGAAYCRQVPRPDCNPFIARRIAEWTAGKTEQAVQRAESPAAFSVLEPMKQLQLSAYDNVAGCVRRSTWEGIRFGNRRFGEDVAFGKQVILSGQSIVYQPLSAVVHSHNRTPRQEGKRIYCDHRNLNDLFGLNLLPDRAAFRAAVRSARVENARVVDALDVPAAEKSRLHRWARGYAFWSALGMYLGANSKRLAGGVTGLGFWAVDRWMRRGI